MRSDYGSTDAADVAGLYLAQLAADAGKLDEARKLWSDFVDGHKGSMLAAEARLNLIALDRKQGKGEDVVKELRAMLEKGDAPLPQDVILHELACTLEQLHRPQEAIQSYQRILDEFPQSPFRSDAQQKVSALDPTRAPAATAPPLGGSRRRHAGLPGLIHSPSPMILPYRILERKRAGMRLAAEEIREVARAPRRRRDGSWSEGQLAAFLMAAAIRGLDGEETRALTLAMRDSGERWELGSAVPASATSTRRAASATRCRW